MKVFNTKLLHFFCISVSMAEPVMAEPVVLELFTSQGCSSCPPAEQYLQELAKSPEVIALSFHVNYWDYLGWKDPFATPEATQRQRNYSINGRVYTPELKINGQTSVVGSNRAAVAQAMREAQLLIPLKVSKTYAGWDINRATFSDFLKATPTLFKIKKAATTAIKAGENSGLKAYEVNIVTQIIPLPPIGENQLSLKIPSLPLTQGEEAVLLIQGQSGAVLAASRLN